jgi:hypothetical protein
MQFLTSVLVCGLLSTLSSAAPLPQWSDITIPSGSIPLTNPNGSPAGSITWGNGDSSTTILGPPAPWTSSWDPSWTTSYGSGLTSSVTTWRKRAAQREPQEPQEPREPLDEDEDEDEETVVEREIEAEDDEEDDAEQVEAEPATEA